MSASHLAVYRALLAKAEASYNAGGSVAASTDGILLAGPVAVNHEYLHDGGRTPPPGMLGYMRRVPPSGASIGFSIPHEFKGAGAAYSASVVPSGHRLIQAAGFDGAVTVTGGSEKWDYTPTPSGTALTSLVMELYEREIKFPVTGVYLNLESIDAPDDGVPMWTFSVHGLAGTRADAQIPTVTYPALTIEPPKATSITFVLGSFTTTAVVRSWNYKHGRGIGPRANQNAVAGHAGFSPGRRTPTLEVLIEATDLVGSPYHTSAGLDPYLFWENATEVVAQLNVGAIQYNRWKLIPGKVQMAAPVGEEEDEGGALWRLMLQCNPTSVNLNDDVTFRFD